MAKKNKGRKSKTPEKKKQDERVTLEALEAMSDSDDDVPESQWNAKAKNLRQAIKDGKFNNVIDAMKKSEGDEEEEDIEEHTLDSSSDVEEEADDQEEEAVSDSDEEMEQNEDGDNSEEENDVDAAKDEQEEESDSEEEDDSEDEANEKAKRLLANNQINSKALAVVTAELVKSHSGLPWPETFDIIPPTPLPFSEKGNPESSPLDIHDDLKREVAFYNTALEAVNEARRKCNEVGVPFSRPDDFFAEMVKTDDHMAKVKDRLIFETKKMDAVAQRKSNREHKLRAKESQSNKLAEKAKRKRDHFQEVEEWANSAAKNRGGALRDDADDVFLKGSNKKRSVSNKKYGFGGKTGRFKQNDRASMNDESGYNPRGNFPGMGTKRTGKSGAGAGAGRQGKRARDANRARKS